ncbi:MAG: LPS export ABC transporter permease LptG [Thiohalophilus sp.]|jgi:lipopolysaccharide export system permease protein
MKLLERYIGQAVTNGVLSVMAVLIALFSVLDFVDELDQIGRGSYNIWHAMAYTILQIPYQLYQIFPMAALLGTMLGLGALVNNRELVIMRVAGLSITRIVWAIMKTALMLMLLNMVIGEVIAPPALEYGEQKRLQLLDAKISLNTEYGLWARDGKTYIHVRRVDDIGHLEGVRLYTFDDHQLKTLLRAKSASYDGKQWQLKNVTRDIIENNEIKHIRIKQMAWSTLLEPSLINVVSVIPETLAVWRLKSYIDYLKDNGLESEQYELAMWGKIVMPFTIAAMVLLAVPFVFGSQRHSSIGQKILIGFLVGVVFYIVNRLAGQMGLVYQLPPLLSAVLPTLIVVSLALLLFRRLR